MAIDSSGKIIKNRRVKRGTAHNKNHRWESFSSKISKLNSLDPIRRIRRYDLETEDLSTTISYLRTGLDKWAELNMSEGFTTFYRELTPMCDSLPQIIHFESEIMSKFISSIEKQEKESLEPLLELITDFAHDLGHLFERHYPKVLEMIISIVERPQDVSIIEMCFKSLTFIFKYLSKLLVSDLRPTYDLVAPILGKCRQRPHIARFAAESLSFLVRKAGTLAHREKALKLFVGHAKSDLVRLKDSKEYMLYFHGLMTLFAEAIKGQGNNLHTSGPAIFQSMLQVLDCPDLDLDQYLCWKSVIFGVLISILHHTNPDSFESILEIVTGLAEQTTSCSDEAQNIHVVRLALLSGQMIGICSGVRKGSRLKNWTTSLKALSNIIIFVSKNHNSVIEDGICSDIWNSIIISLCITFQYAPIDSIICHIPQLMDMMTTEPLQIYFLTFSFYLSNATPERFQSIIMPYFQRFVTAHWSDANNEDILSILLLNLSASRPILSSSNKEGFSLPLSWQNEIASKIEHLEKPTTLEQESLEKVEQSSRDRLLPKMKALLEVLECTVVQPSIKARISKTLYCKLKLALSPDSSLSFGEAEFIMGCGLGTFLKVSNEDDILNSDLEPLLHAAAPKYIRLPSFLLSLLEYKRKLKALCSKNLVQPNKSTKSETEGPMIKSLVSNLSTDSHNLRLLSLQILDQISSKENHSGSDALSIMTMIENTHVDLQTARSVSMLIRKLGVLYPTLDSSSWLKDAIPAFCFGLLTVKFAQIWEDACATLKIISETKSGEEVVFKIIISWLEIPSIKRVDSEKCDEIQRRQGLTDFECSNFTKLIELGKVIESKIRNIQETMQKKFLESQKLVAPQPPTARSQALRVLATAPFIAERFSRRIVPLFLTWSCKVSEFSEQAHDNEELTISDWSRNDQKSLLRVFSHFSNSKSLYKSDEVHTALLMLLKNGDIEIQQLALKALFTWKDTSIKPYEEDLLNLLDEARFREELGYITNGQVIVKAEHRPVLMPVLLRILYGRSMSRKSGRQGLEARRQAIFRTLSTEDTGEFINISLGSLKDILLIKEGESQEVALANSELSPRKLVGLTHMIEGLLKELGTQIQPFTETLLNAVLYCLIYSSRRLNDNQNEESEIFNATPISTSPLRIIRQTGMKCLILLFLSSPKFNWSSYNQIINNEILSPRLDKLPDESSQGISVILRLFSTWSSDKDLAPFLGINKLIIAKIIECLLPKHSKDEVKIFILGIIKNIAIFAHKDLEISNENNSPIQNLLKSNVDILLSTICLVLKNNQELSKELLESCIETASELAFSVNTSLQGRNLIEISTLLLEQPARRVSPKTKGRLLVMLENFIPLYNLHDDPILEKNVYVTLSSLFGYFKDKESREALSRVLMVYSQNDAVYQEIASICIDLNSFVEGRLDEPDYDRRLKAFNKISEKRKKCFTAYQWTPVLYNMLYYIRYDEEFGILSSNSSDGICQLISIAGNTTEQSEKIDFERLFAKVILPALFSGIRETSEVVRREYLKVTAHLIRVFPAWSDVSDMHCLLAGDNEVEASFFNNILAPGKGRRSSALGQLSAAAEKGKLSSKNISQFFIPLIEHFVFTSGEVTDTHNFTFEAISTLGVLSASLKWSQYRATLKRFIGYIELKPESEKQVIRLLGKVIDPLSSASSSYSDEKIDIDTSPKYRTTLLVTLPEQQKLTEDLNSYFLPPLMKYLHDKDDSTVSLRVPVAIIIVKLLRLLPQEQLDKKLPAVLTDVCHILRSKSQEARDMARDTLLNISIILGPQCFGFILKQLQGALFRGSQLHVLSYTMHSLLVATTPTYAPGDLDYCTPRIIAIIMDDVFGATGQEKDAEGYVSKMKEVKSSKSHDSMELIAKTVTIHHLRELVQPIQALLKEKLTIRIVRKIEELLHRISNGLMKNSTASSRDILIFCYQIIQDVYKSESSDEKPKEDFRLKKYIIQKGSLKSGDRGSTTIYTYKMVCFAFDLLRLVLKKYENLRTPANLTEFIPILGDAVVRDEEEIKISAFKLLTTIVKVPLKEEYNGISLYRIALNEAVKTISVSASTVSGISQASLKLISTILRDRKDVSVKDTSIDNILLKIKDDMTQIDRRNVIFNFLRSVLDARVETAIVYDTLDFVGTVMITNNDKETRSLSRGAYFQFLRDYPQKKSRWSKQLSFIVANLNYDREGGRLSVLEVIHLLLSKSAPDFVQEVAATTFVPLIFVLANDESEKCRVSAGELLRAIFAKADPERMRTFLGLLRSWLKKDENTSVIRLAFQAFGFYYESENCNENDLPLVSEAILKTLQKIENDTCNWEEIYFALELISTLVVKFSTTMLSSKQNSLWSLLPECLSHQHAWVKYSALKLCSIYFADFTRSNLESNFRGIPLKGSNDLVLTSSNVITLVQKIFKILELNMLTQPLADEAIKNLVFLATVANSNDDASSGEENLCINEAPVLKFFFGRISNILRRETVPPRFSALVPKISSMGLLKHLTATLSEDTITMYLSSILMPLSNITDPNISVPYSTDEGFRSGYENLKTSCEEIMENLRKKVGTQVYSKTLLKVREDVKGKRMVRSFKRRVEAVNMPERHGEVKRKKLERKKIRRKEKSAEHKRRRNEF
ncbi:U3 small nucleolar RNA-associated protein 20 [Erysiphe neolycopersici]|uniref:U3 small nucleolar RNA-associated protein 20 n=1 Tax=Erysiphe neolycopersici TaxID=212602 RepID=A0A420HKF4_9PEZI|nr:U3 small nucleolar RNA-associated protein 20 [Erysiphe neolycopersici]